MVFSINNMNAAASKDTQELKRVSDKAGLMMLEHAFIDQLQALYDDETAEDGGGLYRDLIPFMVEDVFKGAPHLGVGNDIYKELSRNLNLKETHNG